MTDVTNRLGLPFMEGDDPANEIDQGFQSLAEALNLIVTSFSQGTLAARPVSTSGSPGIAGRLYYVTGAGASNGYLFYDYGTGWIPVASLRGIGWPETGLDNLGLAAGSFSASSSASPNLNTADVVPYDTLAGPGWDGSTGGLWYDEAAFRWTPDFDGYFHLHAQAEFFKNNALAGGKVFLVIRKNGNDYKAGRIEYGDGARDNFSVDVDALVRGLAGDHFDIAVIHTFGGTVQLLANVTTPNPILTPQSYFEGHVIGRSN